VSLQNQISISFPPDRVARINAAVAVLETELMPTLVQLDPALRQQLPKMGDRTVGFVGKALEYAASNPGLQPKYLDLAEAQKDLEAVSTLRQFSGTLEKIAMMVADTMTLCGSEAYSAALSFYNSIKGAAKDRQPGAQVIFEELRTRFLRGPSTVAPTKPAE
jgi:hypothetical protein